MAGRPKKLSADWEGGQQTIFGASRPAQNAEKGLHPREAARQDRRRAREETGAADAEACEGKLSVRI